MCTMVGQDADRIRASTIVRPVLGRRPMISLTSELRSMRPEDLIPAYVSKNSFSPTRFSLHLWLAFLDGSLCVTSISIAGVLQGASCVAGESVIASVDAAAPLWLWRTVGGLMMVVGHIVFFVDLRHMRPGTEPDTAVAEGVHASIFTPITGRCWQSHFEGS